MPTWIIDPAYGNIFTATFNAVVISAAQDAFEILAPQGSLVKIRAVTLGQYSDFGDPATTAEILSVLIVRGYTTAGTGGSTVTPVNFGPASKSSRATVLANNTTVATGGTAAVMVADAWNIASTWLYVPDQAERIILQPNQRAVVRLTLPADAITTNGTLVYEEVAI